jgi:hypothetical protein
MWRALSEDNGRTRSFGCREAMSIASRLPSGWFSFRGADQLIGIPAGHRIGCVSVTLGSARVHASELELTAHASAVLCGRRLRAR